MHQVIEYTPKACFRSFEQDVTDARWAGDVHPSKSILADSAKLMGIYILLLHYVLCKNQLCIRCIDLYIIHQFQNKFFTYFINYKNNSKYSIFIFSFCDFHHAIIIIIITTIIINIVYSRKHGITPFLMHGNYIHNIHYYYCLYYCYNTCFHCILISGNSAYGWVLHDKTKHRNVKYVNGFDFIECFTTTFLRAHSWLNWVENMFMVKDQPTMLVNDPHFISLWELGDDVYEIESLKNKIDLYNYAHSVVLFILNYTKLRMLDFYYSCIYR